MNIEGTAAQYHTITINCLLPGFLGSRVTPETVTLHTAWTVTVPSVCTPCLYGGNKHSRLNWLGICMCMVIPNMYALTKYCRMHLEVCAGMCAQELCFTLQVVLEMFWQIWLQINDSHKPRSNHAVGVVGERIDCVNRTVIQRGPISYIISLQILIWRI